MGKDVSKAVAILGRELRFTTMRAIQLLSTGTREWVHWWLKDALGDGIRNRSRGGIGGRKLVELLLVRLVECFLRSHSRLTIG